MVLNYQWFHGATIEGVMSKGEWKFVARIPEEYRAEMYALAEKEERSINYLVLKAIKELLARNDEAPTTCDS